MSCIPGELTVFLVVVMAQAALVSHLKLAVQFWYVMNCSIIDCAECNTNSVRHMKSFQREEAELHQTHLRPSGAHQVDACCVRELQAVRHAGGAVRELQQQPFPGLDDRPSLGNTHVTDRHDLLRRALRTVGGSRSQLRHNTACNHE